MIIGLCLVKSPFVEGKFLSIDAKSIFTLLVNLVQLSHFYLNARFRIRGVDDL